MTETRAYIGGAIIFLGVLIILELFVPFIETFFDLISANIIFGIILIVIGIIIIQGKENKIEQRRDLKHKK